MLREANHKTGIKTGSLNEKKREKMKKNSKKKKN
jgi:hypothetical protein